MAEFLKMLRSESGLSSRGAYHRPVAEAAPQPVSADESDIARIASRGIRNRPQGTVGSGQLEPIVFVYWHEEFDPALA